MQVGGCLACQPGFSLANGVCTAQAPFLVANTDDDDDDHGLGIVLGTLFGAICCSLLVGLLALALCYYMNRSSRYKCASLSSCLACAAPASYPLQLACSLGPDAYGIRETYPAIPPPQFAGASEPWFVPPTLSFLLVCFGLSFVMQQAAIVCPKS